MPDVNEQRTNDRGDYSRTQGGDYGNTNHGSDFRGSSQAQDYRVGSGNIHGLTGVEIRIAELRSMANTFTSPTAREIVLRSADLIETAWAVESRGGIMGQPGGGQQNLRFSGPLPR